MRLSSTSSAGPILSRSPSRPRRCARGASITNRPRDQPDLIAISSCLMGQTGPLARFAGFGNLAAALCGFYNPSDGPTAARAAPSARTPITSLRASACRRDSRVDSSQAHRRGPIYRSGAGRVRAQFLTLPILDTVGSGQIFSDRQRRLAARTARRLSSGRSKGGRSSASGPLDCDRLPHRRAMARAVFRHWPAATRRRRSFQFLRCAL